MFRKHINARREKRDRRCDAVYWRNQGEPDYETAWALESSANSIAFAWRGGAPPKRSQVLEIHRDNTELTSPPDLWCVRRSTIAHCDLCIIAAERIIESSGAFVPQVVCSPSPLRGAAKRSVLRHRCSRLIRPLRTVLPDLSAAG